MSQDLRSALAAFEQSSNLLRITEEIDWNFEAAAVLWRLSHGPAVLFENIRGYDVPLVGNVLNTREKLATSLGLDLVGLAQRLDDAIATPVPVAEAETAPWQERTLRGDEIDLLELFPVPAISEHDGGRYISAGLILSRDPDTGRSNLAICRLQATAGNRLHCYLAPTHTHQFLQRARELGRPLEVAILVGNHPALLAASQLLVPGDELEHAGAIFGAPLEVTRGLSTDLLIPTGSEIVLEGTIDPEVQEEEGPFGEFPGTYAGRRLNPVVELRSVSMRQSPIFQMIVGGTHPEHLITGAVAREAGLLRAIRAVVPGARAVVMPEGGSCRFHAVISIKKRVAGEGKLAILAAFTNQDLIKHVIVVDDDIDISDPAQVEWALATRMRAHDDLVIVPGCKSNPVDPMSIDRTITKLGIDATLDVGGPNENRLPMPDVPPAVRDAVDARWQELMSSAQGAETWTS